MDAMNSLPLLLQELSSNDVLRSESKFWHQHVLVIVTECSGLHELRGPFLGPFVALVAALNVAHGVQNMGQTRLVNVLRVLTVEISSQGNDTAVRAQQTLQCVSGCRVCVLRADATTESASIAFNVFGPVGKIALEVASEITRHRRKISEVAFHLRRNLAIFECA